MNNPFDPKPPRPDLPTRATFSDLPPLNQLLLGSGAALIALGLLWTVGPPVASGVSSGVTTVIHPYTSEGKEERCQTNLSTLATALSAYRTAHDGHYPQLEQVIQNKGNKPLRLTWVSQLADSAQTSDFQCPQGVEANGDTISSYGFNAALSGVKADEIPHPDQVIVLADRGSLHDLALLPPLEGWRPASVSTNASNGTSGSDAATSPLNVSAVHDGKIGVLFADGHTELKTPGDWLNDLQSWGGALVIRQARARLLTFYPLLQRAEDVAKGKGDAAAVAVLKDAASGTSAENDPVKNRSAKPNPAKSNPTKDNPGKSKEFEKAMQAVYALWAQNDGASFDGETDRWGWQLSKWADKAGQPSFLQFFDKEQSRRSDGILQDAHQSAKNQEWQKLESNGFALAIPANWTREEETEGRYKRTFFLSPSPHITVQLEKGDRAKPGPESGIQWTGIEDEYRKTYGSRYKRIVMGETILAGEAASLWEFEIDRKDAPKLHKLYVGRSHTWDSVIFTATAPAQDFDKWKPMFEQIKDSLARSDSRPGE